MPFELKSRGIFKTQETKNLLAIDCCKMGKARSFTLKPAKKAVFTWKKSLFSEKEIKNRLKCLTKNSIQSSRQIRDDLTHFSSCFTPPYSNTLLHMDLQRFFVFLLKGGDESKSLRPIFNLLRSGFEMDFGNLCLILLIFVFFGQNLHFYCDFFAVDLGQFYGESFWSIVNDSEDDYYFDLDALEIVKTSLNGTCVCENRLKKIVFLGLETMGKIDFWKLSEFFIEDFLVSDKVGINCNLQFLTSVKSFLKKSIICDFEGENGFKNVRRYYLCEFCLKLIQTGLKTYLFCFIFKNFSDIQKQRKEIKKNREDWFAGHSFLFSGFFKCFSWPRCNSIEKRKLFHWEYCEKENIKNNFCFDWMFC